MKTNLSSQDPNSMKINLSSFAKNFYKDATVNDVLKEAVMNSIQANATSIDINLVYQYDRSLDGDHSSLGNLIKIVITDNGEGLTSKNIDAFFEVATTHKASIGGKGLGRISFLNIANKVEIESVSKDEKLVKFDFSYDAAKEDISVSDCINVPSYTQITLSELKLTHPKTQAASCASSLRDKFNLMLFLEQRDNKKNISISILVNGKESEVMCSGDISYLDKIDYDSNGCKFSIYAFKDSEHKGIAISYYADSLQVSSLQVDRNFKPKYVFAITSSFFDERVNPERTQFDFRYHDDSFQTDSLFVAPSKDFENELKRACLDIVHKHEPNLKEKNKARLIKLKEQYGYINLEDIDPNDLFFDEKTIIENYRKKVNDKEDRLVAMLDMPDIPIDRLASSISEQNKHELAKYIFHRDIVAKKGLALTGTKENEDVLHNLFFPQKATAKSKNDMLEQGVGLYENSIWLLDDKFMSYVYAASDTTMKKIHQEIGDDDSSDPTEQRPDLFILYNAPEASSSFKDVVLIEFKKGDINYKDKTSAIDQVDEYKEALMGMVKNIRNFYCYIICDFDVNDRNIERVMLNRGFTKVFSNDGCMYYGYLPGSETHVTFVSSKSIFADAVARNETFLNILKNS